MLTYIMRIYHFHSLYFMSFHAIVHTYLILVLYCQGSCFHAQDVLTLLMITEANSYIVGLLMEGNRDRERFLPSNHHHKCRCLLGEENRAGLMWLHTKSMVKLEEFREGRGFLLNYDSFL